LQRRPFETFDRNSQIAKEPDGFEAAVLTAPLELSWTTVVVGTFLVFIVSSYLRRYEKQLQEWAESSGKTWAQWVAEALLRIRRTAYGLSALVTVLGTLSLIYPGLESQVLLYHDSLLEFATMLITAATVLTGFALTRETIISTSPRTARQKETQSPTYIGPVKFFGVVCVLLSLLAVLTRDSKWWQPPFSWDAFLSASVIALAIQGLIILYES
jgi:hypothetical protein